MELFPPSAKELWDEWGIRVMVICSLLLQVILIFLGNRRKTVAATWVRFILWFAYLSADWFATVALGALSNKMGDDDSGKKHPSKANNQLLAFWAPFLLLHLGGPDTITAYMLEDNELWLRHLLGLVVQSAVAVYIFLLSWNGAWISILNIPMFIAGLIKYGERTWVLKSASKKHLRDSRPDPNYVKFMSEYMKRANGHQIRALNQIRVANEEDSSVDFTSGPSGVPVEKEDIEDHDKLLSSSYYFFETFKLLFVDLILSIRDRDKSISFFRQLLPNDAFKVIELELGFIYDVLFTKAIIVYSRVGFILRSVSFSATISTLVVFAAMEKHGHPLINVMITYLLLCVAVILEIYGVVLLLSSDWTLLWSLNKKNQVTCPGFQFLTSSIKPLSKHRWSNSMAQYNLINLCIKEKPMIFASIYEFLCIDEWIESYHYKSYVQVPDELKDLIYKQLEQFAAEATDDLEVRRKLCHSRGYLAFEKYECFDTFGSSIEVELDQSILLWHIATDLCYYCDSNPNDVVDLKYKTGKLLSDYILYLLVMRPFMLPVGIGQIRFRDTCVQAKNLFQRRRYITLTSKTEACERMICDDWTFNPSIDVKGDRFKSVLYDACELAKSLKSREKEKKWGLINQVWVEILCCVANQCSGSYHAQQLGRGGEFLTHVWLLMAHLGITDQFEVPPIRSRNPKIPNFDSEDIYF